MGFLLRMALTAAGLWLAAWLIPGVEIADTRTLVLAALLLGFVNAFVRPLAILLTLPLTIVTLGLFLWVVNAMMVGLVAWLLVGFEVSGLGPALLASLVLGFTGWLGAGFIGPRGRYEVLVVRRRLG